MTILKQRISSVLLGMGLVLPTAGHSAPGTLSDSPLFIGGAVKHNVMLAIDDSGSMDFETLFPTNDGALWWDDSAKSFVTNTGSLIYGAFSGKYKYTYLFPNGKSSSYNGKRFYSYNDHPSIPPVKAYAFARSSDFNKSYYDPSVNYTPWVSYGGYPTTFSDVTASAAPYDPLFPAFTLDLTSNVSTTETERQFYVYDDMVCKDDGSTCTEGGKHYPYYPATFYVLDNTSGYTYTPSKTIADIHAGNSVILEAESGTFEAPMVKASDYGYDTLSNPIGASGGDFAGTEEGVLSPAYDSPPALGNLSLKFESSGTVNIWVRRLMKGDNYDSFWMNLEGHDSSSVSVSNTSNTWHSYLGNQWNKFYTHDVSWSSNWKWELWATASLSGSSHTLNIKYREPGTYIDQILITKATSYTPASDSALVLAPEPVAVSRSCATDVLPAYYHDFVDNPTFYSGVDAIGPDGSCLKKYEIKDDGTVFPGGKSSYVDQMQNFANWFTYYRRRHQSMRGGLAGALEGVGGINAGIFWINSDLSVDVTMHDMDSSSGISDFLTAHYGHVDSGGTPLRSALKYAGEQYKRTNAGAPITQECQKNYTLLFTDGFNSEMSISGIANEDGTAGAPYQDTYSDTLADIAYKYYTENPRPPGVSGFDTGKVRPQEGCADGTASADADCKTDLHMNTYTVGLGAKGTIYDVTHKTAADAYSTNPVWPDVNNSRDARQIDDLYHAAVNGRGETFNASTPEELTTQLSSALQDIISKIGAGSGLTFNTSTLLAETALFFASFNSSSWSGELFALSVDPATGAVGGELWNASGKLNDASLNLNNRVVITSSDVTNDGIPFRWTSLTADQKDDLNRSPGGVSDSSGENRLNFLRGERDSVNKTFRWKSSRLGDIVHSSPIYVGKPQMPWPDEAPFGSSTDRYSGFKDGTAKLRTPVVYVGANDGMLHGFNGTTGELNSGNELIAYVPDLLYSNGLQEGLHYLTDPGYQHKYYVDQTPVISDVYIKASTADPSPAWRTILVGGLRGGGKGLFALDVTDPTTFSEANAEDLVLWEFTHPDLGYITSPPIIAMMNNDKWAVIFGNGYNATGSSGNSKLFILFIEEGVDGTWDASDMKIIPTGSSDGLSGVAVADLDQNGTADRIYAGDLNGNMWAFTTTSSSTNSWDVAYKSGSTPVPLYTATYDDGAGTTYPQPITYPPLLARNSMVSGSHGDNVLVYFGTGQYLTVSDVSNAEIQSFYSVWDRGDDELDRSDLSEIDLSLVSGVTTPHDYREVSGSTPDWNASSGTREYGWYVDFDLKGVDASGNAISIGDEGERIALSPLIRGGMVFFDTNVPNTNPCDAGGHQHNHALTLDGQNPIPFADINGDGTIDALDTYAGGTEDGLIVGSGFIDGTKLNVSSEGLINKQPTPPIEKAAREGRLGWRELIEE